MNAGTRHPQRPKRGGWAAAVLLLLLAFATPASANVGTRAMIAGWVHLMMGNAVIGILEGAALAAVFSLPKFRTVVAMVAANYASAWLGSLFVYNELLSRIPLDLYNAWLWLWGFVGVTWVLTLVVGWPFVASSFLGVRGWLAKSSRANLVVQSVSYILLVLYYANSSQVSIYTRATIVTPDELALPQGVRVFYISSADGGVYSRTLALETPSGYTTSGSPTGTTDF